VVDKALQELIEKGQSQLTAEAEVGESFYQKANHDGIDKRERRYMADITIEMKLIEEQLQLKISKRKRRNNISNKVFFRDHDFSHLLPH